MRWLSDLRRRLFSVHPYQFDVVGWLAVLGAFWLVLCTLGWVVMVMRGRR